MFEEEDDDELIGFPAIAPEDHPIPSLPAPGAPDVKDYIAKKFSIGQYSPEARQKLVESSKTDFGDRALAALSAVGAGFQGQNAGAAGANSLNAAKAEKRQQLDEFDKGRANTIQEVGLERDAEKYGRDEEIRKREDRLDSQESNMANELAKRMGYKGNPVTATQFKGFSPALQKMYEIEQKKLDREEGREERRFLQGIKRDEKMQGLKTPFGLANNEDDAKKLKEAFESKKNFDNKIEEMIQLRKDHKGGSLFDRESVARGKQLSKDLLLEYKNMAKLGVLSAADEKIINAIIPADPLEFNSPVAAIQGQDPILNNLTRFKSDSDKDFQTRVATRTRGGVETAADKKEKKIVKTQTNKRTGEKRIVYEDGSTEVVGKKVAGQ